MQRFDLKCQGYPGHECGEPLGSYLEYPDHVIVMDSMLRGYQCKPCSIRNAETQPRIVGTGRAAEIKAIEDDLKAGKMTETEAVIKLLSIFQERA